MREPLHCPENELTVPSCRHAVHDDLCAIVFTRTADIELFLAVYVVDAKSQLLKILIKTITRYSLKGTVSGVCKLPTDGSVLRGAKLGGYRLVRVYEFLLTHFVSLMLVGLTRNTMGSNVESGVHSDDEVLAITLLRVAIGASSGDDLKLMVCGG
jgi:hypothetical protein